MPELKLIHQLNPNFENTFGKTKLKMNLRKDIGPNKIIFADIYFQMFDSYYINQNIEILSQFEVKTNPKEGFKLTNQEIEIKNGMIFSNVLIGKINGTLNINFKINENFGTKCVELSLKLKDDLQLQILFDNSITPHMSSVSIFLYSSFLF